MLLQVSKRAMWHPNNIKQQSCTDYIPLSADNNLLTPGELELSTAQGLLGIVAIGILAAHRQKNLPNGNTSTRTLRLAESPSHASLKPISSSTRQHLVYTQNMEGVDPDPQVESVLSSELCHVFVASNTSSFKCLTCHILLLPTNQVHTEGELIYPLFLHSNIIDPDLRIRHTTAVP
nr:hypothetical protein E3P99_02043 [Ipomoea trifida]